MATGEWFDFEKGEHLFGNRSSRADGADFVSSNDYARLHHAEQASAQWAIRRGTAGAEIPFECRWISAIFAHFFQSQERKKDLTRT